MADIENGEAMAAEYFADQAVAYDEDLHDEQPGCFDAGCVHLTTVAF